MGVIPGGVTGEGEIAGVGVVPGAAEGAEPTSKPVVAEELQYESVPRNEAWILYMPAFDGVQAMVNRPLVPSVVVRPRSVTLPSEAIAESFTGTPAGVGGLLINVSFCPYR